MLPAFHPPPQPSPARGGGRKKRPRLRRSRPPAPPARGEWAVFLPPPVGGVGRVPPPACGGRCRRGAKPVSGRWARVMDCPTQTLPPACGGGSRWPGAARQAFGRSRGNVAIVLVTRKRAEAGSGQSMRCGVSSPHPNPPPHAGEGVLALAPIDLDGQPSPARGGGRKKRPAYGGAGHLPHPPVGSGPCSSPRLRGEVQEGGGGNSGPGGFSPAARPPRRPRWCSASGWPRSSAPPRPAPG